MTPLRLAIVALVVLPVAVARRLTELEAHGASIHKAVGRARRGIVRWLRSDGPGSPADMYGSAVGGTEWTTSADAISAGLDTEWCEANPEPSPAHEDTP